MKQVLQTIGYCLLVAGMIVLLAYSKWVIWKLEHPLTPEWVFWFHG